MNVDARSLEVKHNVEARRFEIQLGDQIALLQYRINGPNYVIYHTEVPPEYEGLGIANRLAQVALDTIRDAGAQVVPYCAFIRTYLRRHKEYQPLVLGYKREDA